MKVHFVFVGATNSNKFFLPQIFDNIPVPHQGEEVLLVNYIYEAVKVRHEPRIGSVTVFLS